MANNFFGFLFGKNKDTDVSPITQEVSNLPAFSAPDDYDGTITAESGGFFSTVYDFGGSIRDDNTQLSHYRSMSLYPEVDMAIEDIINESIVFDKITMHYF